MKCNSYSDLFEDFFKTDAVQDSSLGCSVDDSFSTGLLNDATVKSDPMNPDQFQSFFVPQQQQIQYQPQLLFYQQAQMPAYAFQGTVNSIPPTSAAIQKPGFIRNRTRKNMRQKSVAAAVKASHMLAAVGGQAGSGYPLMQMYQQANAQPVVNNQIPFYQIAAQIPSYQLPSQQQQPPLILAKSPVTQSMAVPLMRSGNPSHPTSPARSPNSNSSDYVKFKLQQKIRSRMVSKGQIPPNPTEEELRMCGIQVPTSMQQQQQHHHLSQLPTPKHSPQQQQIPVVFNNNTAAFIAAPTLINNQSQGQVSMQQNDDLMKYLDLSGFSQKDPLCLPETDMMQSLKQQQLRSVEVSSVPEFTFPQQETLQNNNGSINYDQFFSDFILY